MTFVRYRQLLKSWRQSPPTHVLLKILLSATIGYEPPAEDEPNPEIYHDTEDEQVLQSLIRDFQAAGGVVKNGQ